MQVHRHQNQKLFEKIRRLPPDKVAVVDDFVDFLQHREEMENLVTAACKVSEKSFQNVWDHPEDSEYDSL